VTTFPTRIPREPDAQVEKLHATIGRLKVENDFLENALIKAGRLSARK
jgi:hypothetical protein